MRARFNVMIRDVRYALGLGPLLMAALGVIVFHAAADPPAPPASDATDSGTPPQAPERKALPPAESMASAAAPGGLGAPAARTPVPPSRSIGWPWRGRLRGGMELQPSTHVRRMDAADEYGRFWGTVELVRLIESAALQVDALAPGARLTVGELSAQGGGRVPGHRSHENGRDIDVGFYLIDDGDRPVEPKRFIPVRASGRGSWGGPIRFDDQRNWLLIAALLENTEAHVKYVFVADPIRRRLLREARRQGVDEALYARVQRVVIPPTNVGNPHLDHFHVRIYCPAKDLPDCRDRAPYWPWLPEAHPFAALATLPYRETAPRN
jgi:penicillin-insensitive murein endopeptidase